MLYNKDCLIDNKIVVMKVLVKFNFFFIAIRSVFFAVFFSFALLSFTSSVVFAMYDDDDESSGMSCGYDGDKILDPGYFNDLANNIARLSDGNKELESLWKQRDKLDKEDEKIYDNTYDRVLNVICEENGINSSFYYDEKKCCFEECFLSGKNIKGFDNLLFKTRNGEYNSETLNDIYKRFKNCAKESYATFYDKQKPRADKLVSELEDALNGVSRTSINSLNKEIEKLKELSKSFVNLKDIFHKKKFFFKKIDEPRDYDFKLEPDKHFEFFNLVKGILKNKDIITNEITPSSKDFLRNLQKVDAICNKLLPIFDKIRFHNSLVYFANSLEEVSYKKIYKETSVYNYFFNLMFNTKSLISLSDFKRLCCDSFYEDNINTFMKRESKCFCLPEENYFNFGEVARRTSQFTEETSKMMPGDYAITLLFTANEILDKTRVKLNILKQHWHMNSSLKDLKYYYNMELAKEYALSLIIKSAEMAIERDPVSPGEWYKLYKKHGYKWVLSQNIHSHLYRYYMRFDPTGGQATVGLLGKGFSFTGRALGNWLVPQPV